MAFGLLSRFSDLRAIFSILLILQALINEDWLRKAGLHRDQRVVDQMTVKEESEGACARVCVLVTARAYKAGA